MTPLHGLLEALLAQEWLIAVLGIIAFCVTLFRVVSGEREKLELTDIVGPFFLFGVLFSGAGYIVPTLDVVPSSPPVSCFRHSATL